MIIMQASSLARMVRAVFVQVTSIILVFFCARAGYAHALGARAALGPDFLWGVASSDFQVSGNPPPSNWTRYIASHHLTPVGTSVDFYHRYQEDINRAKNIGLRVFRFGVDWSRLEPQKGAWNEQEWDHYDQVLSAIAAAGMRPMVTLDHWVYPEWEYNRGGWGHSDMTADWVNYAKNVVQRAAKYNPIWVTFNEPEMYIFYEMRFGTIFAADTALMAQRLTTAHKQIYSYIHSVQPEAMVTSNPAFIPGSELPFSGIIDNIGDSIDFVGFDYYYSAEGIAGSLRPLLEGLLWKIPVEPEGIYYSARYYSQKFPGKPLYIVENGLPTDNGQPRWDGYTISKNIQDSVYWIERAKADGMNIIGYNYWSLTDNYEWGSYRPRFGLYTVNVETDKSLKRIPTPAVQTYHDIIAHGGVAPDYQLSKPESPCLSTHVWGCAHPAIP